MGEGRETEERRERGTGRGIRRERGRERTNIGKAKPRQMASQTMKRAWQLTMMQEAAMR